MSRAGCLQSAGSVYVIEVHVISRSEFFLFISFSVLDHCKDLLIGMEGGAGGLYFVDVLKSTRVSCRKIHFEILYTYYRLYKILLYNLWSACSIHVDIYVYTHRMDRITLKRKKTTSLGVSILGDINIIFIAPKDRVTHAHHVR